MAIEGLKTGEDDVVFDFEVGSAQGTFLKSSSNHMDASSQMDEELLKKKQADPRFRTQVCSYWVQGRCMKGEACEFLHKFDVNKMPNCRQGPNCIVKDCPFQHIRPEDRPECVLYRQGFCMHGPTCKYRHDKRQKADLPEVGDFNLLMKEKVKCPRVERSELYKTNLCKTFEKVGSCPFGDNCHFAHGLDELREHKKLKREAESVAGTSEPGIDDLISQSQNAPPPEIVVNYNVLPIEPSDLCRYFILKSIGFKNLAVSVKRECWATHRMHRDKLNAAFSTSNKIIFIFSVNDSKHFQGCAQMLSPIPPDTEEQLLLDSKWTPRFSVKWLRICELPFKLVAFLTNSYNNDLSVIRSRDCQELHPSIGPKLLALLYQQTEIELHEEAMQGDLELYTFTLPEEYEQEPYKELQLPSIKSGPGFVFGCNSRTIDECMARLLFGLPSGMLSLCTGAVAVGTTLFLYNMTTRQLFGIFSAVTEPTINLEPQAWKLIAPPPLDGSNTSPFPVQVRIKVLLECPPVFDADPALQAILANRTKMIGPLETEQTQKLVALFATVAGGMHPLQSVGLTLTPSGQVKGGPKNGGWYEPRNPFYQKIFVKMQNHPGFNVSSKLVGKNGETVKNIMNEIGANTRLRLRGRGSGYKEGPLSLEAPEDLHFMVSAENVETMKEAISKTEELIETVREDYLNFLESPASQILGAEIEMGMMAGFVNPVAPPIGPPFPPFPPPPPRGPPPIPQAPGNHFFRSLLN